VWFDAVAIRVLPSPGQGFITANGRSSNSDPSYYVINNSSIEEASGNSVTSGSYYLGRPLSDFARVAFQDTYMSDVVNGAGWSEWSKAKPNTQDVDFAEYDNSGPGSKGTRASFSKKLNSPIAIGDIIDDGYKSWVDLSYLS
jgi:pectinesterase